MELTLRPIWIVDVGGAVLMITLSFLCVRYAVLLRRRDPQHTVWSLLLWISLTLALFAVSRSIGHIARQMLTLAGRENLWQQILSLSSAIDTLTLVAAGATTLFFRRAWNVHQTILQGRRQLQTVHDELHDLNRNLERRVDERTHALAMSEHKYRRIFEESRDLILLTGQDGQVVDINPAGRVMLGIKDNTGGVNFSDCFHQSADWQRLMAEFHRQGFVANTEIDLKTVKNERKRVLLSGAISANTEGSSVMMHFLVKDIEPQQRIREQKVLADKVASIREFSSGIAHEINNPLGIILGYTQLMLRNEPRDSDRTADLKTIEKQVRHCKSIVEDLLHFARTSAPTRVMCDIHALIADALHTIGQHSSMDGIEVRTAYDPGMVRIFLDEKKMRQVFINLLLNARQAVGAHGTITVSTERTSNGRSIRIQVRDTGQGIEARNLARIFDPFFTTKPTGQGTGLGLSVSYGIIKSHGGDIRVESTPGQGAVFTVELPIGAAFNGRLSNDPESADR